MTTNIELDLPDVTVKPGDDEIADYFFNPDTWNCEICKFVNHKNSDRCYHCSLGAKTDLSYIGPPPQSETIEAPVDLEFERRKEEAAIRK